MRRGRPPAAPVTPATERATGRQRTTGPDPSDAPAAPHAMAAVEPAAAASLNAHAAPVLGLAAQALQEVDAPPPGSLLPTNGQEEVPAGADDASVPGRCALP